MPDIADARALVLEDGRQFPTKVAGLFPFLPLLLDRSSRSFNVMGFPHNDLEKLACHYSGYVFKTACFPLYRIKFGQLLKRHTARPRLLGAYSRRRPPKCTSKV